MLTKEINSLLGLNPTVLVSGITITSDVFGCVTLRALRVLWLNVPKFFKLTFSSLQSASFMLSKKLFINCFESLLFRLPIKVSRSISADLFVVEYIFYPLSF